LKLNIVIQICEDLDAVLKVGFVQRYKSAKRDHGDFSIPVFPLKIHDDCSLDINAMLTESDTLLRFDKMPHQLSRASHGIIADPRRGIARNRTNAGARSSFLGWNRLAAFVVESPFAIDRYISSKSRSRWDGRGWLADHSASQHDSGDDNYYRNQKSYYQRPKGSGLLPIEIPSVERT
jgi:hypothetical protein